MKNENKHTWVFPSKGLKALFDQEIVGQLSDGAWENSSPFNHWHFWCNLNTEVGSEWAFKFNPSVPYGHDRTPQKKSAYNLAGELTDPEVVDLSYRMRAYYIDAEIDLGLGDSVEYLAGLVGDNGNMRPFEETRAILTEYSVGAGGDYWKQKLIKLEAILPRYEEFKAAYEKYTRKDLIKDLKLIKQQMKEVIKLAVQG